METEAKTEGLDKLLSDYSTGVIGRRELEAVTGLFFGEVLAELAKRNLSLPEDERNHLKETGLDIGVPDTCPWTPELILKEGWKPND
jgi:hypothetical protein